MGSKSEGFLEIKCKASLINISEEADQSLRRLEETMETTSNLVVSRASEDEVSLSLSPVSDRVGKSYLPY